MKNLEKKTAELTILYKEVLKGLSEVTEGNFQEQMPLVVEKVKTANSVRDKLFEEYGPDEVEKCDANLIKTTKQIRFAYDNMVEETQKELTSVELELKKLQNKKKLVLYGR